MNIFYFENREIDKERWDKLIDDAPNGRIYAYSWYLDVLAEGCWDALIWGDYEYVMPLPWRCKFGIYYVYTPFFVQQLGIFSRNEIPQNLYAEFLDNLPCKFRYLELSVNLDNEIASKKATTKKIRTNYILDIDKSYEEIRNGYKPSARNKLKKKEDFLLQETTDFEKIISDYIRDNSYLVPEIKKTDYERLNKVMKKAFEEKHLIACKLTDKQGEIQASCFFLISHHRAYHLFSSQTFMGKKIHAKHYLIDYFIQKYHKRIKKYDFAGSDLPGVAEFIKKWGATPEYYSTIKLSRFPVNLLK